MPQVTEPAAVESNVAAPVAPVAPAPAATESPKAATNGAPKKAAKKIAPKAAAKKAPVKKAAKAPAPAKDKSGLRKPQERILKYLTKHSDKSFTRAQIAEKAEVDLAMLNSYIGSHDDKIRAKNDKKVCISLVTLGYVKYAPKEEGVTGSAYLISAAGKKAAERLS